VETPRLVLRSFRTTDLDGYAEHLADPITTQFFGGVIDRRAAYRALASGIGFWAMTGGGWWGIELRETGELVGSVGAFFRETSPELEVGWTVYRRYWKQGIATESARAAIGFAFERHPIEHAIAHINPRNAASIRVSQNLGMRYEGEVDFYGETTGRYVIERSAWLA
jgi:RimJ/RimL family protein N-acetyltransferase